MASSDLKQPWKAYLNALTVDTAEGVNDDNHLECAQMSETSEQLCPGSVHCSLEPHPLGTTKHCAVKTKIGIVFMNCSGG